MKYLLLLFLLVAVLITAGCGNKNQDTSVVPPQATTIVTVSAITTTLPLTTVITTVQTSAPTPVPVLQRKITDGFWCRDTTMNIGKAPTDVRECYQFFSDGTYKWGYSPGWPMGKSPSCSGSADVKCVYTLNANSKYEVEGGYSYILSGDNLIDPHNPPYFIWSSAGIP
jgi:hypothetical protein